MRLKAILNQDEIGSLSLAIHQLDEIGCFDKVCHLCPLGIHITNIDYPDEDICIKEKLKRVLREAKKNDAGQD